MRKHLVAYTFLAWLMIYVSGCSSSMTPDEYLVSLQQDEKLIAKWEDQQYRLECRYRPPMEQAIEACQRSPRGEPVNYSNMDAQASSFGNNLRFTLRLSRKDGQNAELGLNPGPAGYDGLLHRLQYEMVKSFSLVAGDGSAEALDCYYERSFGMSNDAVFVITFPRPASLSGDISVAFRDQVFGISVPVYFKFTDEALNAPVPSIVQPTNS